MRTRFPPGRTRPGWLPRRFGLAPASRDSQRGTTGFETSLWEVSFTGIKAMASRSWISDARAPSSIPSSSAPLTARMLRRSRLRSIRPTSRGTLPVNGPSLLADPGVHNCGERRSLEPFTSHPAMADLPTAIMRPMKLVGRRKVTCGPAPSCPQVPHPSGRVGYRDGTRRRFTIS
jgi:hypothetical protein